MSAVEIWLVNMRHALLAPTISHTDAWIKLLSVQWHRLSLGIWTPGISCGWNDPCITVSTNSCGSLSCGGTRSRCAGC